MKHEGPALELLLRRLAECPPEFLLPHSQQHDSGINVAAILCDHLRSVTKQLAPDSEQRVNNILSKAAKPLQHLLAITGWLLHDEWFLTRNDLVPKTWNLWQSTELSELAKMVKPQTLISDADRREELVRLCLSQLDLRPSGETVEQATDRLNTLDSSERAKVLRKTAAAERRAREIREAMVRKRALESASRYGE